MFLPAGQLSVTAGSPLKSLYYEVKNGTAFNNNSIFTPYEPGSIFKPIVMAAALNENLVNPESTFTDTGARGEFCSKPIKNAMEKTYGLQTMSGVFLHINRYYLGCHSLLEAQRATLETSKE